MQMRNEMKTRSFLKSFVLCFGRFAAVGPIHHFGAGAGGNKPTARPARSLYQFVTNFLKKKKKKKKRIAVSSRRSNKKQI
jgi:hypothetical protein